MKATRRTALAIASALLLAASVRAEPIGLGTANHPTAGDPTRRIDPRGLGRLPVSRKSPRRSPAGWLYAFPYVPLRTRPVVGAWLGSLHLEWGGVFDTGREHETRYERFFDQDDSVFLNYAGLTLEHKDKPIVLRARAYAARREDQAYAFEAERSGLWRVRGDFSSLRRHYATDARSLLAGVGSEVQTLRGALVPGGNTPAAIDAAIATLRRETLAVTREGGGVRLDLTPTPALRLFSAYRVEDRDGARPFGGALGFPRSTSFGQWIESSEPVDAWNHEFETGLEWSGKSVQANLRYDLSLFDNRVDALRFENPFDLGDPDIREGRFSLNPSNRAHQIEGDFAWSLANRIQLGGSVSWSRHRQNESLLTPTINSGVVGGAANPLDLDQWNQRAALARDRADARIDRTIAHFYAIWSPASRFRLRASGRIEDHDDDTRYKTFNPLVGAVGYVSEDGALEATTSFRRVFQPGQRASDDWRYRSIPTSHKKQEWTLEGDLRLRGKTRLRATVARRTVQRDYRARKRTRENEARVELSSRDFRRLTLRLEAETASRSGSPYQLGRLDRFFVSDLPGYIGPLPGGGTPPYGLAQHRQFDLADRTNHGGRFRAHWLLRDDMDVALVAELRRENFHAAYGLRHRDADHLSLQWSWRPKPSLEANVVYGFERRWTEMGLIDERFNTGEDPNAGGPWFPFDNRWTQRSRARVHNAGGGLRWRPHARIELSADFQLHHAKESVRYDYASAGPLAAVTPDQAGDRFSDLRFRNYVLVNELRFTLVEGASLRLFHRYQRSFVRDFAQRGLTPNFSGRAVVLAHVDKDYEAQLFGVMMQLRF